MFKSSRFLSSIFFAVLVMTASPAWPLGFRLAKSKEDLGLKYDVAATDHKTGRVTIKLTIHDERKLKPLNSVVFYIPGSDGTGYVDLSLPVAVENVDGKRTATVHLHKDLAKRAEIHLKTSAIDGKREALTWYYYAIPFADHLQDKVAK